MIVLHCCGDHYFADETQPDRAIRCAHCGKALLIRPPARQPVPARRWHSVSRFLLTAGVVTAVFAAGYHWLPTRGSVGPAQTQAAEVDPSEQRKQSILAAARFRPADPELAALYQEINQRHFGGALPAVPIVWDAALPELDGAVGGSHHLQGLTDGEAILVRADLRTDEAELRRTVCHEAVHISLLGAGGTATHHGPRFQHELRRVFQEGCFEAILASDSERTSLGEAIERESARLKQESERLESLRAAVGRDVEDIDRAVSELNARIRTANAQRSGWPSDEEQRALRERQGRVQEKRAAYNAAVERYNAESLRYNREVDRYRLMNAYPRGVDGDSPAANR